MRLISFILTVLFAFPAVASIKAPVIRKPASLAKADTRVRLLAGYFDCFSKNDLEQLAKIKTCVEGMIDVSLPRSEKDRLISWPLLNEIELDQFSECPAKVAAQRKAFGLGTGLSYCASGRVNGKKQVISFYFSDDAAGLKLRAVFY
jgi:hypothetical protein